MSTRNIPGIQRGPEFDKEVKELSQVEKAIKESRQGRKTEANDPLLAAAIDAINEISSTLNRKIDVQWERKSGMVIMTVLSADGEEIIRRLPPEDTIRMAQNLKSERAQYLDEVF